MKKIYLLLNLALFALVTFDLSGQQPTRRRVVTPGGGSRSTEVTTTLGRQKIDGQYYDYRIETDDTANLRAATDSEILDINKAIKLAKNHLTSKYPTLNTLKLRSASLYPISARPSKGDSIPTYVYNITFSYNKEHPSWIDLRYGVKVLMSGKVIDLVKRPDTTEPTQNGTSPTPVKRTVEKAPTHRLKDYRISLEDGKDKEIVAFYNGPTPIKIEHIRPGPSTLRMTGLPPDSYKIYLSCEGYVSQYIQLSYDNGAFTVTSDFKDNNIILYRKRWITLEVISNTKRERDLTGDNTSRIVFCSSASSRLRIIGSDYTLIQTASKKGDKKRKLESGINSALRRHRHNRYFGPYFPEKGEDFESANMAPTNDLYLGDRESSTIYLEKDQWFYMRLSGYRPSHVAYAKVRVLAISDEPSKDVEVLKENEPRWKRAIEEAKKLGINLFD